jgi:hypothetical protein
MVFFIHSGTDIRPFVDLFDTATLARETARVYFARRYPNVRIFNEDGKQLTLADLGSLAAWENEGEDAQWHHASVTHHG